MLKFGVFLLSVVLLPLVVFAENTVEQALSKLVDHGNFDGLNRYISEQAKQATYKIAKVPSIRGKTHTRIRPEYTPEALFIVFEYDDVALKNPELMIKDLTILLGLRWGLSNPHFWFELAANAESGSPLSLARMKNIELALLSSNLAKSAVVFIENNNDRNGKANQQLKTLLQSAAQEAEVLKAAALKYQQEARRLWVKQKAVAKEKNLGKKLDQMILNNDRKGVRQLLEAYLPWTLMEPREAKIWKVWLEAMEHPNLENSVVAFRGISHAQNKILKLNTAGGEVRYGILSNMLSANIGDVTSRLEVIENSFANNGDSRDTEDGLFVDKITDQIRNHAIFPNNTPFISFSQFAEVAIRFIGGLGLQGQNEGGALVAVKIDSRRMIPNVLTKYLTERELLVPLIVFPDEIVQYQEYPNRAVDLNEFTKDLSGKDRKDLLRTEPTYEEFVAGFNNFLGKLSGLSEKSAMCSKVFN